MSWQWLACHQSGRSHGCQRLYPCGNRSLEVFHGTSHVCRARNVSVGGRVLMFIELSAYKYTDMQGKCVQGFILSRYIGCPQLVALISQAHSQLAYGAFLQCMSVLLVMPLRRKWSQEGKHDSQRCSRSVKKMGKALGRQMNTCLKQGPSDWIFILKPLCQPGRISHFVSWQFLLVDVMVPQTDSFRGLSWQSLWLREALEKWGLWECEIKKSREELQEAGLMHVKHKESHECSWSFLRHVNSQHMLQCGCDVSPWALLLDVSDFEESS